MSIATATRYGKLEGVEIAGLQVFKGIPFAAPPIGPLRWSPPDAPASWNGTRDATRFGKVSPQNPLLLRALAAMVIDDEQSEDCLYLNVWTPGADRTKRPVMVWIHGGAFTIGSGSQGIYDGSVLARRGDVVVVTINYRMGPFGFLRLKDITDGKIPSSGNEGLLDQIAALEWVRDNIADFGGDPENVTIFGESAGGMSVGCLMAMPNARRLFHKAIPQSGSCNNTPPAERANRIAERILAKIGVSGANAIRALSTEQLLKSSLLPDGRTPDPELGMAYQPITDGIYLPKPPIEMVREGSASGLAVMVGSTLDEWKLFAAMDPTIRTLDRSGLVARFIRRLTPGAAEGLVGAYEQARRGRNDSTSVFDLFAAIETDRVFRMPGIRLAEIQGKRESQVYNYLFTWPSPAMNGALGSCHALELGFVFGTNHLPGMPPFAGSGPAVEKLATQMQDAWLAFARSGDPSCDSIGAWPRYDESRRSTMIFDSTSKAVDAPFEAERRAWEGVPAQIIGVL